MGELTDREIKVFFEEGILYGIFVGGELGGYIHSLTSSKKTAVLDQFFVHSDHRGRVVGTHTLKLYEKTLKIKGYTHVYLGTIYNNPTRRLYRKCGYRELIVFSLCYTW